MRFTENATGKIATALHIVKPGEILTFQLLIGPLKQQWDRCDALPRPKSFSDSESVKHVLMQEVFGMGSTTDQVNETVRMGREFATSQEVFETLLGLRRERPAKGALRNGDSLAHAKESPRDTMLFD